MNDYSSEQKLRFKPALLALNLLVALGTAAFALAALINPALALTGGGVTDGVDFYAQAYAARAIPLGVAVAATLAPRWRRGLPAMLILAGVVQVGDVFIGITQANPGMITGAAIGTIVPLSTAWWLRARTARRGDAT